jgi:hypothetical protein
VVVVHLVTKLAAQAQVVLVAQVAAVMAVMKLEVVKAATEQLTQVLAVVVDSHLADQVVQEVRVLSFLNSQTLEQSLLALD